MRRHGKARLRRESAAVKAEIRVALEVELVIAEAMWCLRVLRQARAGDIVVAGQRGEVLRVDSVAIDGNSVSTSECPFTVRPEILRAKGTRWVQNDLGDAPSSVEGHVARDERRVPAAPGPQRPGVDLRRTRPS